MVNAQRGKVAERKIAKFLQDGDESSARRCAQDLAKGALDAPALRRYEVNICTIQKLGELLSQNPNGLLLHRDELTGFLRSMEKDGREDERAAYLETWLGTGSLIYDTIGRGTVRVDSNTISIIGGIQPDLLMPYVREAVRGGSGADGLLQRFQVSVWPDATKDWRNVDRWPDTKAKNAAIDVFNYLDALTADAVDADPSERIPFLRFSADAQERFDHWRAGLERRLREDREHPAFEAHLAKYRKLVPAIALILHLADRQIGPISLSALEKALRWTEYLESHARRIYSAALKANDAAARELAKRLVRGDLGTQFKLRNVYRKGWTGLNNKEDAEAAVEILTDLGWLRPERIDSLSTGRPPSPAFVVNPKIRTPPLQATDKTDKSPLLSVLSVTSPPTAENSTESTATLGDTETEAIYV